jgi:glycosyltransferase involved in cell wall biosynthesis
LINQLNLHHAVHIHPYSSEVSYFYHAIDTFLLCSKGETFGTVTIEAMSCALPIIGTDSSGTPEILDRGTCGILVSAEDSDELSVAMERVMQNREEALAMGKRAQQRFLQHYSKEISVTRMKEIVDRTLGKE